MFGIDETIFRNLREDEYLFYVEIIDDVKNRKIAFRYKSDIGQVLYDYEEFVVGLLQFGKKISSLFESISPEISSFKLYEKIKDVCIGDSYLRNKYRG